MKLTTMTWHLQDLVLEDFAQDCGPEQLWDWMQKILGAHPFRESFAMTDDSFRRLVSLVAGWGNEDLL